MLENWLGLLNNIELCDVEYLMVNDLANRIESWYRQPLVLNSPLSDFILVGVLVWANDHSFL